MQVDTIRDLVRRGAARHPELACKLEHAAFIALFRAVSPELDGTWRVSSERDASTSYRVNLNAEPGTAFCTCQDSARHVGAECKHSLAAVMFSRALLGLERHQVFDAPDQQTLRRAVDHEQLATRGVDHDGIEPTPIAAARCVVSPVERDLAAQYERIVSRFEGA